MWIWTVKNQSRSDSTKKHTKGVVNCANKYQMNLVLRLVSVCIKFPEKCNQNVIVTIKKRSDFWSNLLILSVGMTGFEPATTRPPDVYSTGLSYIP